jgi:membrane dipeptidase
MRYFLIFCLTASAQFILAQTNQKIISDLLIVDTHNDFLSKSVEDHVMFDADLKGKTQSDLRRMQRGGVKVQMFSVFCDQNYGQGSAFVYANQELDSLFAVAARNPGTMQIVYSYQGIMDAVIKNKLACLSGVEGGHMIENNMDFLDSFYRRGVRYMTLSWNNSTPWSTSAMDESQKTFKVTPYGLTDFGKKLVKRMNQMGMMVDVSHVGEKTFWDVIANTSKPILASHSSVYALCPVYRNLKDDQIRAIAKNDGVIQVNFFSAFLDSNYFKNLDLFMKQHPAEYDSLAALKIPQHEIIDFFSKKYVQEFERMRPPLSLLFDHIDYIVKLVGVDYVGLGSDFDGIESAPKGLDGVEDFPKITAGLQERGYSETDIRKIMGENFLRVFKANDNYH